MSFSSKVKEEIAGQMGSARHCHVAELAALMIPCARVQMGEQGPSAILFGSENHFLLRKCFTILKKTFNINTAFWESALFGVSEGEFFQVPLTQGVREVLDAVKWPADTVASVQTISPLLLRSSCCKRAALRGLFLGLGSMSDPKSGYHLEFVCAKEELAKEIVELASSFDLDVRIAIRKKYYVAYMKEGAAIVDLLNVMEAHVSLMELENLRILKDISNSVNRRVNCEAANIMKTVNAAGKQVADIKLIEKERGLKSLPEGLQEAAMLRLNYPDMTLSELAAAMDPPIGKSGMNHRLRKLSEIAEEIRGLRVSDGVSGERGEL